MSQTYPAVAILPRTHSLEEILAALAPALRPGEADPLLPVVWRKPDAALVSPAAALDSRLSWYDFPEHTHAAAVWEVSQNTAVSDPRVIPLIDAFFWAAHDRLGAAFGYYSTIEAHGERLWVASVCEQLERRELTALIKPAYRRMLLPPPIFDAVPFHAGWEIVDGRAGAVVVEG